VTAGPRASPFTTHGRLAAAAAAPLLLAVAAPLALAAGRAEAAAVYWAFAPFCHQQAERSWVLAGVPMPICVRCLGFYVGITVAFARRIPFRRRQLVLAAAWFGLSWTAESAAGPAPWVHLLRFAAGASLGTALAAPLAGAARTWSVFEPPQSVLESK